MSKIQMIEILKAVRAIGDSSAADYTEDGEYTLAQALLATGNVGLIASALAVAHSSGAYSAANKIWRACNTAMIRANDSADWEVGE